MAAIVDPMPFMGIDSGIREIRVTRTEARCLLRAVTILERCHALLEEAVGDEHYDYEIGDALCLGPTAIRQLAEEGLPI